MTRVRAVVTAVGTGAFERARRGPAVGDALTGTRCGAPNPKHTRFRGVCPAETTE